MTRFYADLNPAYPAKGEHRWRVFCARGLCVRSIGKSYRTRRSAQRAAAHALADFAMKRAGLLAREVEP